MSAACLPAGRCRLAASFLAPVMAVALFAAPASAEPVEFTLDPARSVYTVTGRLAGAELQPQTPGSNVGRFEGTVRGDLNGGLLHLDPSFPRGAYLPVPQQPGYNSLDPEPAVFGFRGDLPGGGTLLAALKGIDFYVSTEFGPPLDVTDGAFSTDDIGFFINGGSITYHTGSEELIPQIDLHGHGGGDVPRPGSFVTQGDVQTLTLPFETHISFNQQPPEDWTLSFVGQLVATRVVPEPGAAAVVVSLLCAACVMPRRRRRPA